jgi:hypothetical protein
MKSFDRREHCIRIMRERVASLPHPSVRFWKFIEKTETCWLWTGGTFENGYGAFTVKGKTVRAHRYSWELEHGPIPGGMEILHKCDVRLCVRPRDLFIGTTLDNIADRVAKKRSARGERIGVSKLRDGQIPEILARLARGEHQRDIAKLFNVCKSTIGNIKRGEIWSHAGGLF